MEEVKRKDDRMVSLLVNKKISPLLTALTVTLTFLSIF